MSAIIRYYRKPRADKNTGECSNKQTRLNRKIPSYQSPILFLYRQNVMHEVRKMTRNLFFRKIDKKEYKFDLASITDEDASLR